MSHENLRKALYDMCLSDEMNESELDAIAEAVMADDGRILKAEEAVQKRDKALAVLADDPCPYPVERCPDDLDCIKCRKNWIKEQLR